MRAMSDLMRANGVREDARELSREMARAGMMEEILEETLGETLDADGDEDETERAVEDVLREMVGEVEFPETAVGKAETETVVTETVVTETETETTTEDLKARYRRATTRERDSSPSRAVPVGAKRARGADRAGAMQWGHSVGKRDFSAADRARERDRSFASDRSRAIARA